MHVSDILLSAVIQLALFSLIPFIWWIITARNKENFFKWIGLKKIIISGSWPKLILLIIAASAGYILAMLLIYTKLMSNADLATNQFYKQGLAALPAILIFSIIQTGLSEEIFFRGFLGKRFINKFGFVCGNTIQALLFGLLHGLPFGIETGSILVTILLTLIPGVFGWLEGWINEKCSGGSIIPSWIMHSIMNILSSLSSAL